MTTTSIQSMDLTIARIFQDFYRVPDYQREYVWGQPDAKGEGGDQVEQFLKDIHAEFERATPDGAPEYFIGTIVVCAGGGGVYDLIDGQQRTTTSFLTLCALRDMLEELDGKVPADLRTQIAASVTDWKGESVDRIRLDLQYEDAADVLVDYATGHGKSARRHGTRSISNIANAYDTIMDFLRTELKSDPNELRRFLGYFTNLVKLIRIETPDVGRALKIFETINDRGVGLDAMDLLKNLLFMHARPTEFGKLKDIWKSLTQAIYDAREKPLRFLRYYMLATYDVEAKLQEEDIYGWLVDNAGQTGHVNDPLGFARRLEQAAKAYLNFARGLDVRGQVDHGIVDTRALGGSAVKQHLILLLAGRHLPDQLFGRLTRRVEQLMFVWLLAGVAGKDYERHIVRGAKRLISVTDAAAFEAFDEEFFQREKASHAAALSQRLGRLHTYDLRKFRLRYILAKLTRHYDVLAYGPAGREGMSHYLETKNDIEHILASGADEDAVAEFGEGARDQELIQRIGNLMLVELSVNRVVKNRPYSEKAKVYPTSQFLLARCQAAPLLVGVNDRITQAVQRLDVAPVWDRAAVERRQLWMVDAALDVWDVPAAMTASAAAHAAAPTSP